MGFSNKQVAALRRNVEERHIRTRQSNGRELSYLEGWYVISAPTASSALTAGAGRHSSPNACSRARTAATSRLCTRPRSGSPFRRTGRPSSGRDMGREKAAANSLARCMTPGLKAAETDATKRALATFGRPFGLELYRGSQAGKHGQGASRQVRRAGPLHAADAARCFGGICNQRSVGPGSSLSQK